MGGENENGALVTAVSELEAGRENENAGLEVPNEKLGAVVEADEVVADTPNTEVGAGVEVVGTAAVIGAKLKAGVEAGAAAGTEDDAAGTPNLIPPKGEAPDEAVVEENENPVDGIAEEVVVDVKLDTAGVETADDGMPNFIWMAGVLGAGAAVPGLGVSHAAHLTASELLLT